MRLLSRANFTLFYLALVLLLGGASAAGTNGNLLLQVLGAILVGWTLWREPISEPVHTGLKPFALILGALVAVQFLPLPPGLWKLLPGREAVFEGFTMLEVDPPWLTLSLAPWKSLASFAWWIPALALFLSMRADNAPQARHTIWIVVAVALVSVALGVVQRTAGTGYFYSITNYGLGTGFFANSNHEGSFLLCALALLGGSAISDGMMMRRRWDSWYNSPSTVLAGAAVLLLAGVLVSGSLACTLLLIPVLVALILMARPQFRVPLPIALLTVLLIAAGFVAFLFLDPGSNDLAAKGTVAGISRQEFLITGMRIVRDFAPIGSGVGTFPELYRWYEDATQVSTIFVNHAHNDLLELVIETGIFGIAAVGALLAWFVPRGWALWSGARDHPMALAASLVIGVELIHSLVDYPLRTAAMSAVLALALVQLVRPAESAHGRSRSRRQSEAAPDNDRGMIRI